MDNVCTPEIPERYADNSEIIHVWGIRPAYRNPEIRDPEIAILIQHVVQQYVNIPNFRWTYNDDDAIAIEQNPFPTFHPSVVKGSREIKLKDFAFLAEVVENTTHVRLGSIFPSITGTFMS